MTYWQIASVEGRVDFGGLFLKENEACIGPGDLGEYYAHKEEYLKREEGYFLHRFCEEIKEGDILVLNRLLNPHTPFYWEIRAVGIVTGPYRYDPSAAHRIEGYCMPHCRPVEWKCPPEPVIVYGGGAPVKIQRLEEHNPLKIKAEDLLKSW